MNTEEQQYMQLVGHEPRDDDVERMFCLYPGMPGHQFCGFCLQHLKPRFMCGCFLGEVVDLHTGEYMSLYETQYEDELDQRL